MAGGQDDGDDSALHLEEESGFVVCFACAYFNVCFGGTCWEEFHF